LAGKEVELTINMPAAALGASAVQQLSGAVGSSLEQLVVEACELLDDLWLAVWAHLPVLKQLTVCESVCGAVGQMTSYPSAAMLHAP
jgi:hypothetical protein